MSAQPMITAFKVCKDCGSDGTGGSGLLVTFQHEVKAIHSDSPEEMFLAAMPV